MTPFVPNVPSMPHNPNGQPGVAVLDFDRDGDLEYLRQQRSGFGQQLVLQPARGER